MKSYGATVQMKPLQQFFHMVLFVLDVYIAQLFSQWMKSCGVTIQIKSWSFFSSCKDGWVAELFKTIKPINLSLKISFWLVPTLW